MCSGQIAARRKRNKSVSHRGTEMKLGERKEEIE